MQDRDWQGDICLLKRRRREARRILGVFDSHEAKGIKRAWRMLSLKHHPDNNNGSEDSHRQFILVNCAYMFLTDGKGGEELDAAAGPEAELTDGKYRLDNPWGYFAWWREKYFDLEE